MGIVALAVACNHVLVVLCNLHSLPTRVWCECDKSMGASVDSESLRQGLWVSAGVCVCHLFGVHSQVLLAPPRTAHALSAVYRPSCGFWPWLYICFIVGRHAGSLAIAARHDSMEGGYPPVASI